MKNVDEIEVQLAKDVQYLMASIKASKKKKKYKKKGKKK
jgi:hypothetical protein